MTSKNPRFLIWIVVFTLLVSLISPTVVWADDGTPPAPDAPETDVSVPSQAGTDSTSTNSPAPQSLPTQAPAASGSTEVATQVAVTQSVSSPSPDVPSDQSAVTPAPDGTSSTDGTTVPDATQPVSLSSTNPADVPSAGTQPPSTETSDLSASDGNVDSAVTALVNSGSVLVGGEDQPIPLATNQAAQALAVTDPWFDAGGGVIVGYSSTGVCAAGVTECNTSGTPIQSAINDLRSDGRTIFIEQGTYNEDVSISRKQVLTGLGTGAYANSITLESGADVTGSSNIFAPLVNVNSGALVQNGIDLVVPGGTVNVSAGTYRAGLSISKPLILRSIDGAASTILDGGDPYSLFITSRDVTIDGFTITNPGYSGASDASGIVVEPLPYGPNADIRITNNIIHDIGTPGRTSVAYGTVGINIGAAAGIEIDHNEIYHIVHNDPAAWANGISIWGGDPGTPSGNISIHDNSFHDIYSPYPADAAISTQTDVGTVAVHNNSFYNLDEYGVEVRNNNIVNAEQNWWGEVGGPHDASTVPDACGLIQNNPAGFGSHVSQCVTYDPWLTADPLGGGGGTGGGTPASGADLPSVIPVTGGTPTPIGCDTPSVTSPIGDFQVTFTGLCGYEVLLKQLSENSLLGTLSPGSSFVAGVSYVLLKDGIAVAVLPAGASVQVSYPKPSGNASVFAWIDSSWVVQPASMIGDRVVTNFNLPYANAVIVH